VRVKLKTLRSDIEAGVRAPASYTVQAAVDDWLAEGLSGRSERTLTLYRDGVKPLTDRIGARQLRKLTAAEVRSALNGLGGELSTRSLQIARNCLVRAIRHAEADDIVARNVAALVKTPAGREGRPSKALTVEQAHALIKAAAGVLRANGMRKRRGPYRLHPYVAVLLINGIRPEEAPALRWDLLDLEAGTVAVGRSGNTVLPSSGAQPG
jgi:integrase